MHRQLATYALIPVVTFLAPLLRSGWHMSPSLHLRLA